MGNKRITENDFWQCTNGAVPAQLQGSNKTTKKASGEKYITVNDKATSSWIDFGCTKLMLIYALLAAAVVVIAAMTVATGGAALIALGALAGLAGAAWGAVIGTMLCGHLGAKIRKWVEVPKANKAVIQGVTQVTGDFKMTCMIPGGIVTFNPKIKNWNQAIALGASNYLGKLMEGMMAGAAVGMAGALWAGGASAFTSGGIRGIGQAAWQFAKSCPMNIVKNIAASFGYAGAGASTAAVWTTVGTAVGIRTVTATQAGLGHYGNTGESGWGAAGQGVFAMETGMYESGHNMAGSALGWKKEDGTGYSTSWQDVAGMAMLLSPVHKAPEELTSKAEPKSKVEEPVNDGETKKTDEEQTVKDANAAESEAGGPAGEREAFEDATSLDADSAAQRDQINGVEDGSIPLEGYEGHKKGNHQRKGNYGEMKMDQNIEGITEINGQPADLTALHEKITNVDQNGHKGIDGVYENASPPPKYVIAESKYGSSDLSQTPKDGPQMSDPWINGSDRLDNAVGVDKADAIREEMVLNPDNVQRVLTKVDANGNVSTYTLDANGKITGPWP